MSRHDGKFVGWDVNICLSLMTDRSKSILIKKEIKYLMKLAPLFHCCFLTAIYDLSSKVEYSCHWITDETYCIISLFFAAIYDLSSKVVFSCQYKVQNLGNTTLSLDY